MTIKNIAIYVSFGIFVAILGGLLFTNYKLSREIDKINKEKIQRLDSLYNESLKRYDGLKQDFDLRKKQDSILSVEYKRLRRKLKDYEKNHPVIPVNPGISKDSLRAILEKE